MISGPMFRWPSFKLWRKHVIKLKQHPYKSGFVTPKDSSQKIQVGKEMLSIFFLCGTELDM